MMNPAEIAASTGGTVTERAIAILIAAGVTSTRAIADALGITMRAVQKARKATAKRTTVREPQFAQANHSSLLEEGEANHSSQSEPQDASYSSPASPHPHPSPPKRKVSPCTPSKENNPLIPPLTPQTLPSVESVSAGAAEKPRGSAGRAYAFEGDLIRITERDLTKLRADYPAIDDIRGQLVLADAYYAERPEKLPDGKWWFALKRWLARTNGDALQAQKAAQQEAEKLAKDPYYASMVRLGMSREKYERLYPPEIYRGLS